MNGSQGEIWKLNFGPHSIDSIPTRRPWFNASIIPYSLALLNIIFASYSPQRIQNILACIVVGHSLAASSSELLYNLHYSYQFIIALTSKFLFLYFKSSPSTNLPISLLSSGSTSRLDLCAAQANISFLHQPRTRSVTGDRAFS